MQSEKVAEDVQRKCLWCENSKHMMYWRECSAACEMVHGANNYEPYSLQTGSGAQFLGTKLFGVENFQSSHRHGTLNWEEYTAMCMEKKQHRNGVSVHHILCFTEAWRKLCRDLSWRTIIYLLTAGVRE